MEGLGMPLKPLEENATQEEINSWIVEAQEEYNKLKRIYQHIKITLQQQKKE